MPCNFEHADPIDAVITWVDGEDPVHKAKLNAYLGKLETLPEIASPARFQESGEFAYCIASLLRFAPWLRRIHIVTDAQEPAFMPLLRDSPWHDKVVVVDHKSLFQGYEKHLPTFNIYTLISMLWRCPDLAERFLFLNDDFALLRPVGPDAFFRGESLVLRGHWCLQPQLSAWIRKKTRGLVRRGRNRPEARPSNHLAQSLAARMAGYSWRYFRVPHVPHPLRRSLLAEYFDLHPEQLEANLGYRIRSEAQFLADALVNHLAHAAGRVVVDNRLQTLRFRQSHYRAPRLERLLAKADCDERIAFTCIQSLESIEPERRKILFDWLDRRIGRPEELFGRAAGTGPS